MRHAPVWTCACLAVAVLASGCSGSASSNRNPRAGASFTVLTGGGTGGAYELPMAPPAIEASRDERCQPGLRYLPVQMASFNGDLITMPKDLPPLRIGVMDDMVPFEPDARMAPIAMVRRDTERERMVPPHLRIDMGVMDRSQQFNPELNRTPIEMSRYRTDEEWWCDPTGERRLR